MTKSIITGVVILSLVFCFTSVSCGSSNIADEGVAKEILRLQQEVEDKNSEIESLKQQVEELKEQLNKPEGESEEIEVDKEKSESAEIEEMEEVTDNTTEELGTRKNPAGIGETFKVTRDDWLDGSATIEIELTEVISGEEAWNMVKSGNRFNDEPPEGKEYMLAKFKISVIDAEEEPFDLNHAYFDVVSGGGIEYTDFISVSGLEPDLRADIYTGATHEGWTYFLVDTDDNPLAVFDRKDDSEIWFKLRQ